MTLVPGNLILDYNKPLKPQIEEKFRPALRALSEAAKRGIVIQIQIGPDANGDTVLVSIKILKEAE